MNSMTMAVERQMARNAFMSWLAREALKHPGTRYHRPKRLNLESAIRRSLSGAKGLRP